MTVKQTHRAIVYVYIYHLEMENGLLNTDENENIIKLYSRISYFMLKSKGKLTLGKQQQYTKRFNKLCCIKASLA